MIGIKKCKECGLEFEVNLKIKRSHRRMFCSSFCAKSNNGKRNKGKKQTDETKSKKSKASMGEKNHFYGKTHTNEAKSKISKGNSGKIRSEEFKDKTRNRMMGSGNHFYGKKHTQETKDKIRKIHRDCSGTNNPMYGNGYKLIGSKNGGWCGGITEDPYSKKFNRTLKNIIRRRDNFTCVICGKFGNEVHHIDYDKLNSDEKNLITLCHSDHMRTNANRNYWMAFLNDYTKIKYYE
ncbi:hypothetical protein LCGC14_1799220 [marine sediment metagenome]|uniref:HNH nuclease domain-containing protein n=1 Tax=marine sediment metagenome TaxID=412755 RepID=A0A0F9HCV3_9ZZZZ